MMLYNHRNIPTNSFIVMIYGNTLKIINWQQDISSEYIYYLYGSEISLNMLCSYKLWLIRSFHSSFVFVHLWAWLGAINHDPGEERRDSAIGRTDTRTCAQPVKRKVQDVSDMYNSQLVVSMRQTKNAIVQQFCLRKM